MLKLRHRLTIIIVPQTGRRTLTLHLSRMWFALFGLFTMGVMATAGFLWHHNRSLHASLVQFEETKRINYLQQVQIDEMTMKALETQEKLQQLARLETQIRAMTGASPEVPGSTGGAEANAASTLGRGGPESETIVEADLPLLSNMLPPGAKTVLFSRRGIGLPDHSRATAEPGLNQAQAVSELMSSHLQAMDHSASALARGKLEMEKQLDFLAHRPTGIPVSGAESTDRFGWRRSPFGWGTQFHNGLDLAADYGTPISATGAGVVTHAGWKSGGFGYTVMVDHGYGFTTLYAHLSDWDVTVGQEVKRGDLLGWVGSTGSSTGPHLHYEVHEDGVPVDPSDYLD